MNCRYFWLEKLIRMFSKACEYGIRAVIYIADQSEQGRRVNQKDIAKAIGSPEAFTAKILQQLARNGIVDSAKGPNGGFIIDRKKRKTITLSELVMAIDGKDLFVSCALGLRDCNAAKPCPLHGKFVKIRNGLKEMMDATTLNELAIGLQKEQTWLKV